MSLSLKFPKLESDWFKTSRKKNVKSQLTWNSLPSEIKVVKITCEAPPKENPNK